VAELLQRGHETTLLLKGPQDPEYVEFLAELSRSLKITDRVTFEDYADEVWSILDAADAVLISAPTHCFGRIAAEGMLRAKPVVYPAGTDIAEYMEDGVTGLGYDAGNHQQMADQIERLIVEPELRHQIGAEAHRRATKLFTREGFANKFLEQAYTLKATEPRERPPLPRLVVESLLTGIQRSSRESLELRRQLQARSDELASATTLAGNREEELEALRPVLAARDQELTAIKPVLAARDEELAAVKSVLAAREEELAAVKSVLVAREEELGTIKPLLAAREEELGTIKPTLERREEVAAVQLAEAIREEELTNLEPSLEHCTEEIRNLRTRLEEAEGLLARIQTSQLGRLALWVTRGK